MTTSPETVRTYNSAADAYDAHVSNPADSPLHAYYEKPAIRAELPDIEGLSVLSIGCGNGADAQWLKENGADRVSGVDISIGLVRLARDKFPNVNFQVMDMARLGFKDESFDLAYSSLAIHYLPDWALPLREAYRVLRPGSHYVFSCNHPLESALEYFDNGHTRGAHLGRTIIQATEERIIYGDYLAADYDGGVRPTSGTVAGDHAVDNYHRPFGRMVEDIIASGFSIKKLVEPVPLEEMQVNSPEHYKQVRKLPKFAIWVLEK